MAASQHAVDLKPQSARARQALMSALYARGEIAAGLAEGEKAVALNPYDMIVLHAFGMRLLLSGQIEKGAALLQRAAALSPVRPAAFEFALFLSSYLLGDHANTANQARLFTNDDYPLILVSRAVAAVQAGDIARAQHAVDRLVMLHPGWRDNVRARLERYIPSAAIVDRLAADLTKAGLTVTR
jgi:tetratricopeptide (TPR) repeat protein